MTAVQNNSVNNGRLITQLIVGMMVTLVMAVFIGLPSGGMHQFLNTYITELTYQQFTMVWFINATFWGFTFLVTEMIHVEHKWFMWPRWARIHSLFFAACAYGVLLQSVKLFVPLWDSLMGV